MEQVTRALGQASSAGLGQVVVSGMGGVGKTQLAVAVFDAFPGDLQVWVTATSREAIIASYAEAAVRIDPQLAVERPEWVAATFMERLATLNRPWMVVLDDVVDEDNLTRLLPRGRSGSVLITTRLRHLDIGATQLINVDVFTPLEAYSYLEESLANAVDSPRSRILDEAEELAEDLGHLPLALSHAVAVIAFDGITCADYRRRFADRTNTFRNVIPQRGPGDYGETVATTWTLAIDQADRMTPVGLARPAIELAAVLDANGAPEALWTATATLRYAARTSTLHAEAGPKVWRIGRSWRRREYSASPDDLRRALRNLHYLRLLSHQPDNPSRAIRTHALVQRAVADALNQERLDAVVHCAADALTEIWPYPENNPSLVQALRTNTDSLRAQPTAVLWHKEAHPVLFYAGRSLGESGLSTQAVDYFTQTAQTTAQHLGPHHADTLNLRALTAYWLGQAGPDGAIAALEQLLPDQLQVLGPDHTQTLQTRHNIAFQLGEAGDPHAAISALEQLLTDLLRVLGPDHSLTLQARQNITYWLAHVGDRKSAIAQFEELLADRIRILGTDHPDTLDTRYNIAYWMAEAGDHEGAAVQFGEVLADRIRILGPDHPDVLLTRHQLAYDRGEAGDPQAAVIAFVELLPDLLRVFGPDHPRALAARAAMAHWQGESGDAQGAATALRQVLSDEYRVLGPDHPSTLKARYNLARWLGEAGDPKGAAAAFEDVLADRERILGPGHPDTRATRLNLALWRGKAGNAKGAAATLEEVLAEMDGTIRPDHPLIFIVRYSLARWRRDVGDPRATAAALEDLVQELLSVRHVDRRNTQVEGLGYWLSHIDDPKAAATALQQVLDDQINILGSEHPNTIANRHALAYLRDRLDMDG